MFLWRKGPWRQKCQGPTEIICAPSPFPPSTPSTSLPDWWPHLTPVWGPALLTTYMPGTKQWNPSPSTGNLANCLPSDQWPKLRWPDSYWLAVTQPTVHQPPTIRPMALWPENVSGYWQLGIKCIQPWRGPMAGKWGTAGWEFSLLL